LSWCTRERWELLQASQRRIEQRYQSSLLIEPDRSLPVAWPVLGGPLLFLVSEFTGCRSLMVRQMVHLKTCSSLGQRTSEPQVMQFPVAKSLLTPFLLCPWMAGFFCLSIGPSPSESESQWAPWLGCLAFFLLPPPENKEGNGWLIDRLWLGRFGRDGWRSDSEELESAGELTFSERSGRVQAGLTDLPWLWEA